MHTAHHPTCNASVPHHLHNENWTTQCHNSVEARCYRCDRFFCDDHIRKHECESEDPHPASD